MAYKKESSSVTIEQTKFKEPSMYHVIMHNDDYTTMDFVVSVLVEIFHKSHDEAVFLMAAVHNKGQANVGTYTLDIAETKVALVTTAAREQHFPLLCTIEEE